MKVIRLAIATIGALWTLGVVIGVVQSFGEHQGVRGTTQIFAGIGATALCLVITVWLFQWALRPRASATANRDKPARSRK